MACKGTGGRTRSQHPAVTSRQQQFDTGSRGQHSPVSCPTSSCRLAPRQQRRVCEACWALQHAASCKQGNMLGCDVSAHTIAAEQAHGTQQREEQRHRQLGQPVTHSAANNRLVLHQLVAGCAAGQILRSCC